MHRCRYEIAWLELRESAPWRGQAHLQATRRSDPTSPRIPFTVGATRLIAHELLPAVAGHLFERWWDSLHRSHDHCSARACAATARRIAAWWDQRAELAGAYAAGHVMLRPHAHHTQERARTQLVADTSGRLVREELLAEAVLAGDHVGWLTRSSGDLIPDDELIVSTT